MDTYLKMPLWDMLSSSLGQSAVVEVAQVSSSYVVRLELQEIEYTSYYLNAFDTNSTFGYTKRIIKCFYHQLVMTAVQQLHQEGAWTVPQMELQTKPLVFLEFIMYG